jgi:hypothetical protein
VAARAASRVGGEKPAGAAGEARLAERVPAGETDGADHETAAEGTDGGARTALSA